jgi:hypothetical protein
VVLSNATGDSTPSQVVEQPNEQCVASATLWLPAKPAPANETETP